MPRPTKYTPDVVDRIVKAIQVGAAYHIAAKYAGISYETFNLWKKEKPQFLQVIEKAEGDAATRWLGRVEQAAQDGEWQAAAWKLERRYPQDYGRQVHEHSGPEGGPIQTVVKQFGPGMAGKPTRKKKDERSTGSD